MPDIKHKKGIIRIQKSNFKGYEYIDVRKYYLKEETGEWLPTKKGIAIPPELVDEIITALKEVK